MRWWSIKVSDDDIVNDNIGLAYYAGLSIIVLLAVMTVMIVIAFLCTL